jgi:hypothetical protein
VPANVSLLDTLRRFASEYHFAVVAVYRRGEHESWPLHADSIEDLEWQLHRSGSFLPLPREPAALANVLEVSLVDYLLQRLGEIDGAEIRRGTERGYPDLEISGPAFGGGHHALDVKIARRASSGQRTQSRITLYTGNTYFRWPSLHWPGTFRPFQDYASHLDLIGLYDLDDGSLSRVSDLELVVAEPWRIASRQRSSTTREYLGAVQRIDDLRAGRGEFETEAEFYAYWRRFPFKIGAAVEQQLRRLLAGDGGS